MWPVKQKWTLCVPTYIFVFMHNLKENNLLEMHKYTCTLYNVPLYMYMYMYVHVEGRGVFPCMYTL